MKKILFICGLLAISVAASAQLKLHSDGKLSFNTTATPNCPISLNGSGNADFFMSYEGNKRFLYGWSGYTVLGASFINVPKRDSDISIAASLYSIADNSTYPYQIAIGAYGRSKDAPYNYGVLGTIDCSTYGAGVVGSSQWWVPSYTLMNQKYAGFFMGDVKITSNLIVNGSIQGTVLGPSASSGSSTTQQSLQQRGGQNISDLLTQLEVYSRRYDEERSADDSMPTLITKQIDDSTTITFATRDTLNYIGDQERKKSHFALDAEQLEEVFPDLVYEMNDGSKAINYVEMVPLLVQCINELNARLTAVDGGEVATAKARTLNSETSEVMAPKATAAGAKLFQNTPNPFTERTEILFSLPDDARNAYIYIFDMTGKMLRQIPVDSSMQSVAINGYELSAGIYLYSLVINGKEIDTKRMILSK